MFILSLCET